MPSLLQDIWIGELILLVAALSLIAVPAYRIAQERRLRIGTTSAAVTGYILCVALSGVHVFEWQLLEKHAETMRARTGSAVLPEDWGSDFSSEDRTKYSIAMAQHAFRNWGEIAFYIDPNGKREPYVPTKQDHQRRAAYLAYLESIDVAKSSFLAYALAWPFVPLLAIWFALSRFGRPLMRLLTRRSTEDRPQAAGRLSNTLEGGILSTTHSTSTRGLFRVVLWGGVWAGIGVLSLVNELPRGQPQWWAMAVLSILWVAVCFKQILELTKLRAGSSNERLTIVAILGIGVLTALAIVSAAYLYTAAYTMHLLGLYVIPSSAVLGALLALLAWRAERKAKVRVFVGNRGWVYVDSPSNPTPHPDARDMPPPASDISARASGRER